MDMDTVLKYLGTGGAAALLLFMGKHWDTVVAYFKSRGENKTTIEVKRIDDNADEREGLWKEIHSLRTEVAQQGRDFRIEIAGMQAVVVSWQEKYLTEREERILLQGRVLELETRIGVMDGLNSDQAVKLLECEQTRRENSALKLQNAHLDQVIAALGVMLEAAQGGRTDAGLQAQAAAVLEGWQKMGHPRPPRGTEGPADDSTG